jgi:hypothetical protein
MFVRPDVSGTSSHASRSSTQIVENTAIAVLAAASTWALGSAMLEPALIAIAALTPVALVITLRHSR